MTDRRRMILVDEMNLTLAVNKLREAMELAGKCEIDNDEANALIKGVQSTVEAMLRFHSTDAMLRLESTT